LVALCTLWFSPVVWGYHFTAATPALAAISARRAAQPRRAWTGAALWLAVLASFAWRLARAFGAALWLTFLVGAIMVWTRDEERGMRDEGRDIQ
jgi:cobalamin biosynthesis protein CobD/CbiB